MDTKLGMRIEAACQAKGLTLRKLAAELELDATTPRKWIVRGGPSHRTLAKVADYLGMSIAEIHATAPASKDAGSKKDRRKAVRS